MPSISTTWISPKNQPGVSTSRPSAAAASARSSSSGRPGQIRSRSSRVRYAVPLSRRLSQSATTFSTARRPSVSHSTRTGSQAARRRALYWSRNAASVRRRSSRAYVAVRSEGVSDCSEGLPLTAAASSNLAKKRSKSRSNMVPLRCASTTVSVQPRTPSPQKDLSFGPSWTRIASSEAIGPSSSWPASPLWTIHMSSRGAEGRTLTPAGSEPSEIIGIACGLY